MLDADGMQPPVYDGPQRAMLFMLEPADHNEHNEILTWHYCYILTPKCTVILVMSISSLRWLTVLCSSDNIWNDPSLDLDTDLPSGWRTIRDSTGTYYWHVPTGTTQWQHPSYSNEEEQSAVNGITATDLNVRVLISKHSSVLLFEFGCFILKVVSSERKGSHF